MLHAWDKSPNPFRTPVKVNEYYKDACDTLRVAFGMSLTADGDEADVRVGEEGMEDAGIKRSEVDEIGFNEDKAGSDIESQSEIARSYRHHE